MVSDVDADVVGGRAEGNQVAGPRLREAWNRRADAGLVLADARQVNSEVLVHPLDQAGAVQTLGRVGDIDVVEREE